MHVQATVCARYGLKCIIYMGAKVSVCILPFSSLFMSMLFLGELLASCRKWALGLALAE